MYTSPAVTRLVKDASLAGVYSGVRFDVAVLDLDFDDHRNRPTIEDFSKLVMCAQVMDHTPNVVYATRGGARFIYCIEPIMDVDLFERHYHGLLERIRKPFENADIGYQVDLCAKDWTRLFRAPLVTRDDKEEFDYYVGVFHDNRLSLTDFRTRKTRRVTPEYSGNQIYRGGDRRIINALARLGEEGTRNSNLYKLTAYVASRYEPESRNRILDMAAARAAAAGLEENEISHVIQSALGRIDRAANSKSRSHHV
jgi:hypothetical protein